MKHLPSQFLYVFICAIFLASCAPTVTSVNTTWDDVSYDSTQIKKILVIALSSDPSVRRTFEEGMQKQLATTGVRVVTNLDGIDISDKTNRKVLDKALRRQGVDAILVSRLVAVESKNKYIPGRVDYVPTYDYVPGQFNGPYGIYDSFYGYFPPTYQTVYTPGYLKNTKIVRVETNIYETKGNKLVWSAVSKTFDPTSTADALNSLEKAIASQLIANRFFK